ncbi:MAG: adenine phosphoribosyltransferase [Hyphomicrobiales bacterium]|nr:adenine phosphoribosyltransferase [Hyphomicrobiales bacterium]
MKLVHTKQTEDESLEALIKRHVRVIPDFPRKGILFQDITTLLQNPGAFYQVIEGLVRSVRGTSFDVIAAIEARGFILGGAMAHKLGVGFVPLRKAGKLPWRSFRQDYDLEYGTESLEVHVDSIHEGTKVLVVDDLLATGGTMEAAFKLITRSRGKIAGARFVIELAHLGGRERLVQADPDNDISFDALYRIDAEE